MTLKTNFKTYTTFLILSVFVVTPTSAQFWKKLKKKVQNKIEQKVEEKIDKETDKVIDNTLEGKKEDNNLEEVTSKKSYGSASINHSVKYGNVQINQVYKTKVTKTGNQFRLIGNWFTVSVDVFDGYILDIKNITSIEELNKKKTFKIPEEASLKLSYDPIKQTERESSGHGQDYYLESGFATVTFIKDKNVSISFNGSATLSKAVLKPNGIDEYDYIKTPVTVSGMINTISPEYRLTRAEKKQGNRNQNNDLSENDKKEMLNKLSPTVNIPSTFSFNKGIEVKMTDERGDHQTVEFLTGNYPDIYGMSVAPKEMQGQEMLIVNTPKSMTMFMNMGGMKIKKSTSIEQMGDQYNMVDKIPEEGDFEYKKTGKTKTIIGYLCEEVKVDYEYTDQNGSASFWVSKDFPIQNKALPMLGMKMNNPNFSGFVLEMNTIQNGKKFTIEVTNISDKNVTINTSKYKNMGF